VPQADNRTTQAGISRERDAERYGLRGRLKACPIISVARAGAGTWLQYERRTRNPSWRSGALHGAGIRGWRCHARDIAGKPDIAFTRWNVAVFVDGAFWHGHPVHFNFGISGSYWDAKIARTQERDRIANEALTQDGGTVLRFWDFEVMADVNHCVLSITSALERSGRALR
jgi:DNA mismatch endonuclease (patch repair protein)